QSPLPARQSRLHAAHAARPRRTRPLARMSRGRGTAVKLAARTTGNLSRALARLLAELEPAALDAAADVLANVREREDLHAPLIRGPIRAAAVRAVARALSRRR